MLSQSSEFISCWNPGQATPAESLCAFCFVGQGKHEVSRGNGLGQLGRVGVSVRKEVIQPQVLLQLPCYDFTPVMSHTVGTGLPEGFT